MHASNELNNALRLLEQARDALQLITELATDYGARDAAMALVTKIDAAGFTYPPSKYAVTVAKSVTVTVNANGPLDANDIALKHTQQGSYEHEFSRAAPFVVTIKEA